MTRLRIRYSKIGKVRFVGHRDLARIWERSLRRAGLPVAYSEGFSPRPKLSFGLALSTGYESRAEYLEVDLVDGGGPDRGDTTDPAGVRAGLNAVLPVGIEVSAVATVERGGDSLQQAVGVCTWEVLVDGIDPTEAAAMVGDLLAREEIVVERERKGRVVIDDIRHQVHALDVKGTCGGSVRLHADLGTQPRALRPDEMLVAMDPPLTARSVCRMKQWMLQGGERIEPLPAEAAPAPPAEVRA